MEPSGVATRVKSSPPADLITESCMRKLTINDIEEYAGRAKRESWLSQQMERPEDGRLDCGGLHQSIAAQKTHGREYQMQPPIRFLILSFSDCPKKDSATALSKPCSRAWLCHRVFEPRGRITS